MMVWKTLLSATAFLGSVAISTAQAAAPPYIYSVIVKTSFGTRFADCFSFVTGTLTVAGLGTLKYTAAPTDPKHFYTAVATPALIASQNDNFAFAGFKTGDNVTGTLSAVGADYFRNSYTVKGVAVPSCTTSQQPTSPWLSSK